VESADSVPGTDAGDGEPSPGLDVHASAALDRLTRWAAKALRASIAIVTLADEEATVVASATGSPDARESPRLAEFALQILRTAQPHAIGDARSERWRDSDSAQGVAFLGAPLLDRDGHAVGSFCVMDTRPRRFTIQDVELVSELTSSAMTELDLHAARAEAEREKRWSDRQQAVLELIAARAPLARTLTELLKGAETHAPGMLAAITRLEHVRGSGDKLRMVAAHGLPRGFTSALDGAAVAEGSAISGTAAFRREPVVVRDITDAGLQPWFVEIAQTHGLRAGWSTPILSRTGAVLGTFTIYYRTTRTPDGRDRVVIDRSAHLARLAIEQVDGAEALRRNATRAQSLAREQTALQLVATRVAGETDPAILFSLVAEQVGRLLKAEAGYVLRFEDDEQYRNIGCWARSPERLLPPDAIARHLPDGICAQLRRGRTTARRCSVDPRRDALGFRNRIAAPVIVDGRSWGMVLAMHDTVEFRREDEKRLLRFAQLASVAVANARAHEALATQARTDSLTGLANRRAFDERLADEAERANRHTRALSVMLVDVDHFKTINDRFGHATGDRVLVNLADSLRSVMRSGDLLARIGGDEMAMILPDCSTEQAALVAQRMLAAIGADSSLARRHGVTLSAGVAGLAAGQSADDLLRCADQALYAAKDDGRNQVAIYEADMPGSDRLRLSA
jgi:diguanylate cyclase (GGDEF)-like protein